MAHFFVYTYMSTFMYTQVCTHTRHPSFSIKVMADWHHGSLGSFPLYFTWEAEVPRRSEGMSFDPGAVATFQLSWPREMAPSTSLTAWLGSSSVIWVTSTLAECSAPHPGSYSKGPQDQWEPLWALALVLLEPFRFSLPTHTDTTDITVFPCSRTLKEM